MPKRAGDDSCQKTAKRFKTHHGSGETHPATTGLEHTVASMLCPVSKVPANWFGRRRTGGDIPPAADPAAIVLHTPNSRDPTAATITRILTRMSLSAQLVTGGKNLSEDHWIKWGDLHVTVVWGNVVNGESISTVIPVQKALFRGLSQYTDRLVQDASSTSGYDAAKKDPLSVTIRTRLRLEYVGAAFVLVTLCRGCTPTDLALLIQDETCLVTILGFMALVKAGNDNYHLEFATALLPRLNSFGWQLSLNTTASMIIGHYHLILKIPRIIAIRLVEEILDSSAILVLLHFMDSIASSVEEKKNLAEIVVAAANNIGGRELTCSNKFDNAIQKEQRAKVVTTVLDRVVKHGHPAELARERANWLPNATYIFNKGWCNFR